MAGSFSGRLLIIGANDRVDGGGLLAPGRGNACHWPLLTLNTDSAAAPDPC